jgi:hypothetical protein
MLVLAALVVAGCLVYGWLNGECGEKEEKLGEELHRHTVRKGKKKLKILKFFPPRFTKYYDTKTQMPYSINTKKK